MNWLLPEESTPELGQLYEITVILNMKAYYVDFENLTWATIQENQEAEPQILRYKEVKGAKSYARYIADLQDPNQSDTYMDI